MVAGEWMDEHGMTWLSTAPRSIKLLSQRDARKPYPVRLGGTGEIIRLFAASSEGHGRFLR